MDDDIKFRLTNIESLLNKIFKILEGNGAEGLVTTVALHGAKISEIPSPKALKFWSAVGGGIVTSTGLVMYLIYMTIKSAFGGGGS